MPISSRKTAMIFLKCSCGILSTIRLAIAAPKKDAGINNGSPYNSNVGSRAPFLKYVVRRVASMKRAIDPAVAI